MVISYYRSGKIGVGILVSEGIELWGVWRKSILGRGDRRCGGFEVGERWMWLRNKKEVVSEIEVERIEGKVVGDGVRSYIF